MKTITILDWDDTLFPTSWVIKNNNLDEYNFTDLDIQITKLINILIKIGNIFIVTNALPIWINRTLNVLPRTKSYIKLYNIQIRYPRLEYNITNNLHSKIPVFNDIYTNNSRYEPLRIISIGDDQFEFIALKNLLRSKNKKSLNFIWFKKQPDYTASIEQISCVCENIHSIK
jgi:hypothetical protein